MLIEKYVRKYLFIYNNLTIKNFGKFSVVADTEFNKANSSLYLPLSKKVIFNKHERDFFDNDFFLFVGVGENISPDEAYRKIQEDVNYLKLKLNNDELVTIKDIGSFKFFNEEFTFFGITSVENNPFLFGLKPLKL